MEELAMDYWELQWEIGLAEEYRAENKTGDAEFGE